MNSEKHREAMAYIYENNESYNTSTGGTDMKEKIEKHHKKSAEDAEIRRGIIRELKAVTNSTGRKADMGVKIPNELSDDNGMTVRDEYAFHARMTTADLEKVLKAVNDKLGIPNKLAKAPTPAPAAAAAPRTGTKIEKLRAAFVAADRWTIELLAKETGYDEKNVRVALSILKNPKRTAADKLLVTKFDKETKEVILVDA